MSDENLSDEELSDQDTPDAQRLLLGGRVYNALWKVFVIVGACAFVLLAAEFLGNSGWLSDEHEATTKAYVGLARNILGFVWPLLLVGMPATYLLSSHAKFGFLWPAWALAWVPLSFVYGHSFLVEHMYRNGIFGAEGSDQPQWNLWLLNADYFPYALNIALKGAALDLLESFKVSIAEPSPTENIWLFRSVEFVFRSLYSVWTALVIFRIAQFFGAARRRSHDSIEPR